MRAEHLLFDVTVRHGKDRRIKSKAILCTVCQGKLPVKEEHGTQNSAGKRKRLKGGKWSTNTEQ